MKTIVLNTICILLTLNLGAQRLSLPQLLNLTSTSPDKFLQTTARKGYRPVSGEKNETRVFHPKDTIAERYLVRHEAGMYANLRLEKLTPEEYQEFRKNVLEAGFKQGRTKDKVLTDLFEKEEMTITAAAEIDLEEEKRWYNVVIERRNLPRIKDISYAEDLLPFNSHQHLLLVFGKNNVTADVYHNPDGSKVKCSVVYPNTAAEAVFLWKDPENLRQLHCIRVGGNRYTTGALQHSSQIAQNRWFSKQGVYATMTLNQLQSVNESKIRFVGWGDGANGNLCEGNKGRINFEQLDLELSCLNCNDDNYYGKEPHDSESAISDSRRIYVTTMIFYPNPIAAR